VPSAADDQARRNLLGAFLFSGDDIYKSVGVLSGGEKSRLALLKIMLLDTNLLILDEPTNHLDIRTKDIFQNALIRYSGTVAIVSHDRYFLDHLVNRVFELKDGALVEYRGNYSYFIEKRTQTLCAPADSDRSGNAGRPAIRLCRRRTKKTRGGRTQPPGENQNRAQKGTGRRRRKNRGAGSPEGRKRTGPVRSAGPQGRSENQRAAD
jgi:ATP-binding cassette subfamily F protein 3